MGEGVVESGGRGGPRGERDVGRVVDGSPEGGGGGGGANASLPARSRDICVAINTRADSLPSNERKK